MYKNWAINFYEKFWENMRAVISECSRILKSRSRLILVVSKENLMDKRYTDIGNECGLSEDRIILKRYRDYKKKYLKYEYIVILKKE